ncbi:MAG: M15 family metallopeptidase [Aridibacter sp.]
MLKKNSQGKEVIRWQTFLSKQGYSLVLDGIFGVITEKHTKAWQTKNDLIADGIVGSKTLKKAELPPPPPEVQTSVSTLGFPPRPDFKSPSQSQVESLFGKFSYTVNKDKTIKILDDWANQNIIKVHLPQLEGVVGFPPDNSIYFHKKGEEQLKAAFDEIEAKGLTNRIISWGGSFYPRMVRGSSTKLSNHSYGTAFDINVPQNYLNQKPAAIGQKGCLIELVPIFNKYGFFWGGHYNSRLDAMHFELAVIQPDTFTIPKNSEIVLDIPEPSASPAEVATTAQPQRQGLDVNQINSNSAPSAQTQVAENITNVATGAADELKDKAIDIARELPPLNIPETKSLRFHTKILTYLGGLFAGTMAFPPILENLFSVEIALKLIDIMVFVLPYLIPSIVFAVVAWYAIRTLKEFKKLKLQVENNTKLDTRDFLFVKPQNTNENRIQRLFG